MKPGSGSHNIRNKLFEGRDYITKAATATLTKAEVEFSRINAVHGSSAIALTIPAASADQEGSGFQVRMGGAAAVTVVVSGGFAGVGSGGDTVTLAQGEFAEFYCDGSYWYNNSVGAGA